MHTRRLRVFVPSTIALGFVGVLVGGAVGVFYGNEVDSNVQFAGLRGYEAGALVGMLIGGAAFCPLGSLCAFWGAIPMAFVTRVVAWSLLGLVAGLGTFSCWVEPTVTAWPMSLPIVAAIVGGATKCPGREWPSEAERQ